MASIARRPGHATPRTPLLLRLYPATWRARYGEEFGELMRVRPPSPRDQIDIVLGAVDARLHPQVGPGPANDAPLGHDRSIGGMLLLAGTLFTAWAGLGALQMPRWDSVDQIGSPELQAMAQAAGWLAAITLTVALVRIGLRYDRLIGGSGAVGGVLTGAGLLFASAGGGVFALLMICAGTTLFAWRIRNRLVGTLAATGLVVLTFVLVGAIIGFAASDWQDVRLLWGTLAYGPAWMIVGFDLRAAPVGHIAEGSKKPQPAGA